MEGVTFSFFNIFIKQQEKLNRTKLNALINTSFMIIILLTSGTNVLAMALPVFFSNSFYLDCLLFFTQSCFTF